MLGLHITQYVKWGPSTTDIRGKRKTGIGAFTTLVTEIGAFQSRYRDFDHLKSEIGPLHHFIGRDVTPSHTHTPLGSALVGSTLMRLCKPLDLQSRAYHSSFRVLPSHASGYINAAKQFYLTIGLFALDFYEVIVDEGESIVFFLLKMDMIRLLLLSLLLAIYPRILCFVT